MMSVNVSEGVNELTDGMVRSFKATTVGGNGSKLGISDYEFPDPPRERRSQDHGAP